MKTIDISVVHPFDNSNEIEITCPESIMFRDIFYQLVEEGFLSCGYQYKGILKKNRIMNRRRNRDINNNKTVVENGCVEGDVVLIEVYSKGTTKHTLPPSCDESSGIKDSLGMSEPPNIPFSEMVKSESAIAMVMHQRRDYEAENKNLCAELERIKLEGNDRRSAVLVNTVAGIVMSIGTAFIVEAPIPAFATICAGIITTAIGLWLGLKQQK